MKRWLGYWDKTIWVLASFAIFLMVILTFEQVVARYLFNESSIAIQELQWHLFGFSFLVCSGATLTMDKHVRVDIFYGKFSPGLRIWIDIIGLLFFLMPSMALLLWFGILDVIQTRSYGGGADLYIFSSLFNDDHWSNSSLESVDNFLNQWVFVGESSSDPGGLPARWLVKSLIPMGAALCLIGGIRMLITKIYLMRTRWS